MNKNLSLSLSYSSYLQSEGGFLLGVCACVCDYTNQDKRNQLELNYTEKRHFKQEKGKVLK